MKTSADPASDDRLAPREGIAQVLEELRRLQAEMRRDQETIERSSRRTSLTLNELASRLGIKEAP